MSVEDVIRRQGPRKILALDGDGIGGLITVEGLAAVERERCGAIAARSSGSWTSSTTTQSGREMFDKARLLRRSRTKYEDDKLKGKLKQVIGEDTTLRSDELRTLRVEL